MNNFKFDLNDRVSIKTSGEIGKIKGRAEYLSSGNQYHISYAAADGRAVNAWWDEDELEIKD